jgi:hypothetical protein
MCKCDVCRHPLPSGRAIGPVLGRPVHVGAVCHAALLDLIAGKIDHAREHGYEKTPPAAAPRYRGKMAEVAEETERLSRNGSRV